MAHKYRDPYSNKVKSSRYHNLRKEKQDMRRMIAVGADRWYPWPVTWSDYEWDWHQMRTLPTERAYPKRNWRGQRSKQIKTQCHRKNRRDYRNDITNSTYNKNAEFWWELD